MERFQRWAELRCRAQLMAVKTLEEPDFASQLMRAAAVAFGGGTEPAPKWVEGTMNIMIFGTWQSLMLLSAFYRRVCFRFPLNIALLNKYWISNKHLSITEIQSMRAVRSGRSFPMVSLSSHGCEVIETLSFAETQSIAPNSWGRHGDYPKVGVSPYSS